MLRKIAYAAPAAVMAISLTGCMGIGDDGKSDSGDDKGNGGVALSAAQAMNKAANNTASADSYKMSMRMNMAGKAGGRQRTMHMAGTGQYQLKPSMAFTTDFNSMSMGGKNLPSGMQMRFVDKTIYMKMGMLQKATGGKPWIKLSTSQLGKKSGMNFDEMLRQAQEQANPITYTKMFTSSKDVKKAGKQTVRGVETTHYTGTVDLTKAFAKLDPKLRKSAQKQLQALKKVKFDLFADNDQLPRKIVLHGATHGMKYSTTMMYSDFGDPVHVSAPPAGQTTDGSKLGHGMPN